MSEPIDTIRILVDWKCNLKCSYCCNEQPAIRDGIRPVWLEEIDWHKYKNVCITGGEPLLFPDRVKRVCDVVNRLDHIENVILYTNGTQLGAGMARLLAQWGITAINVGLHAPRSFTPIIKCITAACEGWPMCVRFHAQDIWKDHLEPAYPGVEFRFWSMNDCDRPNEDRVILQGLR